MWLSWVESTVLFKISAYLSNLVKIGAAHFAIATYRVDSIPHCVFHVAFVSHHLNNSYASMFFGVICWNGSGRLIHSSLFVLLHQFFSTFRGDRVEERGRIYFLLIMHNDGVLYSVSEIKQNILSGCK